jgi:hypothetical protein
MDKKKYWFFGSKLNSILLLVLIILMVFAIRIMLQNKTTYLPFLQENKEQILGNKEDLVSFSILPNAKVHGVVLYQGVIKGGYFFEANILINILDSNKKVLMNSHALSTTDWMTAGEVNFEGNIDFTNLEKGPAYFEIHNDNPSDIRANDKSILIPIIIE